MYWLLSDHEKHVVRQRIENLVLRISDISGSHQADQLFPFVGRKDRRKAEAVISSLSEPADLVIDCFSGSGIFTYAARGLGRSVQACEWEPYTWRMSTAPWRLVDKDLLDHAIRELSNSIRNEIDELYWTRCVCGYDHVLDSLFFDRVPLRYDAVTKHERLGRNGETVTFRGKHKCPHCKATEKHFDSADALHMQDIESRTLPEFAQTIFNLHLIENSRINLSKEFTTYASLFPKRSQIALSIMWEAIQNLDVATEIKGFLEDAFLAILPQAKYKDYRSKSQDLHCPEKQLREVNLFYRFIEQVQLRNRRLREYSFSSECGEEPIQCTDFRSLLSALPEGGAQLVFTDPPWSDGNAYFEKAQLYHPWLNYDLSTDRKRLEGEVVVSDAPSRKAKHDIDRWWQDIEEFFLLSSKSIEDLGFLAVYFRPIPAKYWLQTLNRLKFIARSAGFEPLLTVDAGSNDPSMRIQQSASFVFSSDLIFVFLKLPTEIRRLIVGGHDIDHLVFRTSVELQDELGPYTFNQWKDRFRNNVYSEGISTVLASSFDADLVKLFRRYNREISDGRFLPRLETPFSGQYFDIPVQERLFASVPAIIDELFAQRDWFTYEEFLLKLASFVENGTRMLIQSIEKVDVVNILSPYVDILPDGRGFTRKPKPDLPDRIQNILSMDPYDFERFVAALFEAQGYSHVAQIGGAGDRGVDVTARDPQGKSVVIQCKRYRNSVSADPIQRLHSFAISRKVDRRIVVTTSHFTPQAIEEAQNTHTELIDGDALSELVARYLPNTTLH